MIAVLVTAILGLFADYQNRVLHEQDLRAGVLAQLNVIRAKLEGNVNGNIQLVRGLVATLATEPDMTQERFSSLAKSLFREDSQLRNIAAAPGMVITMIHPMTGNEKALGLDYRTDPVQGPAAIRAHDTRELVLAGPLTLRQGGRGLIGRFPVFVDTASGGSRFWGIVSAVVDLERLYRDSGLTETGALDVALVGQDATGSEGQLFYGRPGILHEQPVTATVVLPTGSWRIAAVPVSGWMATPPNAWLLRTMILIAGALVVVPILIAGRFYAERRGGYLALQRSEQALQRVKTRLELALGASRIGVWEMDLETNTVLWDDRLYEIYGLPREDGGRSYEDWARMVHPDDLPAAENDYATAIAGSGEYSSIYRIVRPDGRVRHIRTHAKLYREADEAPRMIGAEWDITADVKLNRDLERAKVLAEQRSTELEAAKASIEYNALHDPLTGTPNRRYLDEVLERLAAEQAVSGGTIALLHIDLDRFKHINDTLGHAAGDAMLVHAATVLKTNVRPQDFVARIGGDEFVVVCELGAAQALQEMAERIIRQMRKPVPYENHLCRFGVSIGIAKETGAAIDPKRLLVNADIALYRAKRRGRNRLEFFTDALQAEIVRTKRVADEILGGLERGEFVTYYQPQFDARTLEIAGVEALVRWNHPTEGLLAPGAFLKTAEELNVEATIDRMVLEQTLANFEGWRAAGLEIPRVSVNVSARRLRDEELVSHLKRLPIRPGTLSFELVESIFLDEADDHIVWNVDRIKDLGIDIEIDDFGTGHASIISLLKLKPRCLKIDRQLVAPVVRSPKQRQLVASIVEIGKSLGIDAVAEGVETMAHARYLKDLGCAKLQGYAFGKPMSSDEFQAFVRARQWRKAS